MVPKFPRDAVEISSRGKSDGIVIGKNLPPEGISAACRSGFYGVLHCGILYPCKVLFCKPMLYISHSNLVNILSGKSLYPSVEKHNIYLLHKNN